MDGETQHDPAELPSSPSIGYFTDRLLHQRERPAHIAGYRDCFRLASGILQKSGWAK